MSAFLLGSGLDVAGEPGVLSRQEVDEQLAWRYGRSKAEVSGAGLCRARQGDLVNPSEFENELVVNHRYTEE